MKSNTAFLAVNPYSAVASVLIEADIKFVGSHLMMYQSSLIKHKP